MAAETNNMNAVLTWAHASDLHAQAHGAIMAYRVYEWKAAALLLLISEGLWPIGS